MEGNDAGMAPTTKNGTGAKRRCEQPDTSSAAQMPIKMMPI